MEHHSKLLYLLYFAAHHVLWQAVFRYSEHEHAARLRLHLYHLYVEAHAGQVARYGKPRRPGPYDGHAAAGLRMELFAYEAHVAVEVGNEAFEHSHADARALLVEHAVAFALLLVGAYAAAHCGQVALVVDYLHGVAEVPLRYFVNPVGDVLAYGASLGALRHLAVEAALGLVDGLKDGEALVDLVEEVFLLQVFFHINI